MVNNSDFISLLFQDLTSVFFFFLLFLFLFVGLVLRPQCEVRTFILVFFSPSLGVNFVLMNAKIFTWLKYSIHGSTNLSCNRGKSRVMSEFGSLKEGPAGETLRCSPEHPHRGLENWPNLPFFYWDIARMISPLFISLRLLLIINTITYFYSCYNSCYNLFNKMTALKFRNFNFDISSPLMGFETGLNHWNQKPLLLEMGNNISLAAREDFILLQSLWKNT